MPFLIPVVVLPIELPPVVFLTPYWGFQLEEQLVEAPIESGTREIRNSPMVVPNKSTTWGSSNWKFHWGN